MNNSKKFFLGMVVVSAGLAGVYYYKNYYKRKKE
jgi:hypothetical protein